MIKNVSELRDEMIEVFESLKNEEIDNITVKAFVATSNAIMKTTSQQMEYNKMTGKNNNIIPFLITPEDE